MNQSLIAAALVAASTPVFAEIDPIVIIGDRYETKLSDTVQSISVIDAQSIADSGATTVAQVLSQLANVTLHDSQGNGNSPSVALRGFSNDSAQNVVILIDGVPVDFATKEGGQLGLINLSSIQQIEVMSGSAGVLYGDGTTAGAINIVTTTANYDSDQVRVTAGSFGHGEIQLNGTRSTDTSAFSYAVSAHSRDGYRYFTDTKKDQINLGLTHDFGGVTSITRVNGSVEDRRTQGTTAAATIATDRRSGGAEDSYRYDRFGIAQTFIAANALGDAALTLTHQTSDQEVVGPSAGFTDTERNDVRLTQQTKLGNSAQAVVGIERKQTRYHQRWSGGTYKQASNALFGRVNWDQKPSRRWVFGVRTDQATIKKTTTTRFDNSALELGVRQSITPDVTLSLRADTHYRLPTLDEISSYPNLVDQTGRSIEASLDLVAGRTRTTLTAFQIDNKNEISYSYNPGFGGYWETTNLDRSTRRGISAASAISVSDSLALNLGINLLDTEFSDGTIAGNDIPMAPAHTVTLGVAKTFADESRINVQARYESSKSVYDDYANDSPKLPSFVEVDLAWSKTIKNSTDLGVRISNLFDRERFAYGVRSGSAENYVPNMPRTFEVSLTRRF
ncbi:TonB-dependent receptor [Litorivicinus lipolyticus]|uniref:TonB-dependent receptor n=1 Tax=Litorivicinus lipolyticus TaxID=418701 RepID=UPI003B59D1D5